MLTVSYREVVIPIHGGVVQAEFQRPGEGHALVVFAHGSGSSRHSPRNRFVAGRLAEAGFGTLLLDLLTEEEDRDYENRFDIPLLASRLKLAVEWSRQGMVETSTPITLFGASTGAAAALIAAVELGRQVSAIVCRGGRPDLAHEALPHVSNPTRLIVGELDFDVLALNRQALSAMPGTTAKDLVIVPGATHLFEEPGALERVAELAIEWFLRYEATPNADPVP